MYLNLILDNIDKIQKDMSPFLTNFKENVGSKPDFCGQNRHFCLSNNKKHRLSTSAVCRMVCARLIYRGLC